MRLSTSRKSVCIVKGGEIIDLNPPGSLEKHTFLPFTHKWEDRETVSAVSYCLLSISKEQSLQVPKSKKNPKKYKERLKNPNPKPVIKIFPKIAQVFLCCFGFGFLVVFFNCGELQKSVSWAGRRSNATSIRAGSTTGESGGMCRHSSATHHRGCLKHCHSLQAKALSSLRHLWLRITSSSIIFQTNENVGSKISSPSRLYWGLEIYWEIKRRNILFSFPPPQQRHNSQWTSCSHLHDMNMVAWLHGGIFWLTLCQFLRCIALDDQL